MTIGADRRRIDAKILGEIERRILWLAIRTADRARELSDVDLGGRQAESASIVSIMTALRFGHLRGEDRVVVNPDASAIDSAIDYLTNQIDRSQLISMGSGPGQGARPRTDSMGHGAMAPLFSAAAHRYVDTHFGPRPHARHVAVVRDTKLDEGSVWEAIADPVTRGLGNVMLVIDLNRQRLDEVVPDAQAIRLRRFFTDAGWHVVEARYGHLLQAAFARPHGEALRYHIDSIANEAYQDLFAMSPEQRRARFLYGAEPAVVDLLEPYDDAALADLIFNLGGHDMEALLDCFQACDRAPDRPSVVFAHTVRGWSLPLAGDPLNHSAMLSYDQVAAFRSEIGLTLDTEWDRFDPDGEAGQLCAAIGSAMDDRAAARPRLSIPSALDPEDHDDDATPQQAFADVLVRLADLDDIGPRLVTASSPSGSMSVDLGAWIDAVGEYDPSEHRSDRRADSRSVSASDRPGRHVELSDSEANLFAMLGQLGLAHEHHDELLLPIGVEARPHRRTSPEPLIHAIRSGARFVLVGTAPRIEIPELVGYHPTFIAEVDWMLCHALERLSTADGGPTYIRLPTIPIDQAPFAAALGRLGHQELRQQVLAGGYRLIEPGSVGGPAITIVTAGSVVTAAVAAADELESEGVSTTVVHLTSPDVLYRGWQQALSGAVSRGTRPAGASRLENLISTRRRLPRIVSVNDGISQALSWVGTAIGVAQIPLGSDQRPGPDGVDLRDRSEISAALIVNAALLALEQEN